MIRSVGGVRIVALSCASRAMATAGGSPPARKKRKKGEISDTKLEPVDPATGERFTFFWGNQSPFSQWHPASFESGGVVYNCAEHYMMHQKAVLFKDEKIAAEILQSDEPRTQKALGRKVSNFDQDVWNEKCRGIVKQGNIAKFSQNPELKQALLVTRGTTLVEASPRDCVWGIGYSAGNPRARERGAWRGTNWLGEVLTQVREELATKEEKGGGGRTED